MTYSIIARDPDSGYMGVATQSQAFAVGGSVPWASSGTGVVATQSMGEPMYGDLGLDALRAGLTAPEVLAALRSVDPHPERRQVGIVDMHGGIEVYTGEACVAAAGHQTGDTCAALANIVEGPGVWESMVEAYEKSSGWLPRRLLAALHAAEEAGGDSRGQRSAAVFVVRAERSGRPWRDTVTDLRVDNHPDSVREITRMVEHTWRYHSTIKAFELALDGDTDAALEALPDYADLSELDDDMVLWRAIALASADRMDEARTLGAHLADRSSAMVAVTRRFGDAGLVSADLLDQILP